MYLLKEKLKEEALFSIYVYEESGDIYIDDLHLIANTREIINKLAGLILLLNILGILFLKITDCPLDLFNQYVDLFDQAILRERQKFV